ncbi:MAG TPA: glutamate 5-kinase [Chthoniobacterales bacterium]
MSRKIKRIVLKFGSGILARADGKDLDMSQCRALMAEIVALMEFGYEVAAVSSGAVAAGLSPLGFSERPTDMSSLQACAAVGQSRLMQVYESQLSKHGLHVGQLLLTYQDLDSRLLYLNTQNTLERLFECRNVVPILNENDPVAIEELRFGDNDRLSAEVAILAKADLLLMCTSVDGLIDPKTGQVVPLVRDIEKASDHVQDTKGKFSVGGMKSKLGAASVAARAGIPVVITNGRKPETIRKIVAGEKIGTRVEAR